MLSYLKLYNILPICLPTALLNKGAYPASSNNLSASNPNPKTVALAPPVTQAPLIQVAYLRVK